MTSVHVTYTECLYEMQESGWYREFSFVPIWDEAFFTYQGMKKRRKEGEHDERSIRENQTRSIKAN